MSTSGKTLITTPSIVAAIAAISCIAGLPKATATYNSRKAVSISEKEAKQLAAEHKETESKELKRLQDAALNRIKNYCVIAHHIDTGLAAESINQGAPFYNLKGSRVANKTPVCARDGSTAIVIYNDLGEPVLANIATVHRDDMAVYEQYYNTYRKTINDSGN